MLIEPPGHGDGVGPEVACLKLPEEGRKVGPSERERDHKNPTESLIELSLNRLDEICWNVGLVLRLCAESQT